MGVSLMLSLSSSRPAGLHRRGPVGVVRQEKLDQPGDENPFAAGLIPDGQVGVPVELGLPGIGQHQSAVFVLLGLHERPAHGRALRGDVGAHHQDQVGLGEVSQFPQDKGEAAAGDFFRQGQGRLVRRRGLGQGHGLVGQLGGAEDFGQRLDGPDIIITARVVKLAGAQALPEKFLKGVVGFVGGPGRSHPVNRLGAVGLNRLFELGGYQVQGLVPGGFPEFALIFDQRGLEAVVSFHRRPAEPAPAAEQHGIFVHHPHDLAVFGVHVVGAAAAAEGAGDLGLGPFPGPGPVLELLVDQGPHRADVDAGAAEFAIQGYGPRGQFGEIAPQREIDGHGPHPVPADAHAAAAGDAAVRMALHHLGDVVRVGRQFDRVQVHRGHRQGVSQVLQLAFPALVADGALQGMVDEHQLHQLLAQGGKLGRVGHHLHAFGDRSGAGRDGPGWPGLHVHHADAAAADGFQGRMVAKEGDENPVLFGHFQDGRARFRLNGPPVDGQIYHRVIPVLKCQKMFQVMCGDCPTVVIFGFSITTENLKTLMNHSSIYRFLQACPLYHQKRKTENGFFICPRPPTRCPWCRSSRSCPTTISPGTAYPGSPAPRRTAS